MIGMEVDGRCICVLLQPGCSRTVRPQASWGQSDERGSLGLPYIGNPKGQRNSRIAKIGRGARSAEMAAFG